MKGYRHKRDCKCKLCSGIIWNKGITLSEEHKNKIGLAKKGQISPRKGVKLSEEIKRKIGLKSIGRTHTKEWKKDMSDFHKNNPTKTQFKKGSIPWNKGKTHSKKTRKKISLIQKELWQNKEYRERQIKSIFKGFQIKPNKPEKRLIKIIEKHKLPFKYTGDGSFWMGGINPDFVESNGRKIAIEIFGKYWHSPLLNKGLEWKKTLPGRKGLLKKYGWKLIVFWEDEIYKDEKYIINKLK